MANKRKSNKALLGFFVIAALVLFTIVILIIGGRKNIFSRTITAKATFNNVTGLMDGSKVTFNGIDIGTVTGINIMPDGKIELTLDIINSAVPYIKTDSKVSIITEGLVGNKVVQISAGSIESQSITNGYKMQTVEPIAMETIIDNLNNVSLSAGRLTNQILEISRKINEGEGTLGQLLNNPSIYNKFDSLYITINSFAAKLSLVVSGVGSMVNVVSIRIDSLAYSLDIITDNITEITTKINSSESLVGTLLTDTAFANNIKLALEHINIASKNLEDGAFGFNQNMEALKHNFFFKGYFEDLGYWDRTDFEKKVTPQYIDEQQKKLNELEKLVKELKKKIEEKDKGTGK